MVDTKGERDGSVGGCEDGKVEDCIVGQIVGRSEGYDCGWGDVALGGRVVAEVPAMMVEKEVCCKVEDMNENPVG